MAQEKGTPRTFSTMTGGQQETVTVFEKTFDITGVSLVMVYIPEGTLQVGGKTFTLQPFYMGKFPVTQAQYQAVMSENPSWEGNNLSLSLLGKIFRKLFKSTKYNFPVGNLYWKQAREFCQKLSVLLEKDFRLPSEVEWEYACRAGTSTKYWWGNSMDNSRCWYNRNSGRDNKKIHRVDERMKEHTNPFGLCDMHGNIWEWCQDEWHNNFTDASVDGTAYGSVDKDCPHLLRGGSWFDDSDICCSAYRVYNSFKNDNVGFRIVFPVLEILNP